MKLPDLPDNIRKRMLIPVQAKACWRWEGSITTKGYGRMWQKHLGTTDYAHRIVYKLLVGPIPKLLTIDHLCKNKRCVNPKHLELVPIRVNILRSDGPAAINARKKVCKLGHPLSGKNLFLRGSKRNCRTCFYAACRRWKANHRDLVNAWKRASYHRNKKL